MDVEKLKAILKVLEGTEVSRLDWTFGEERIELRFGHPPASHAVHTVQTSAPAPVAPVHVVAPVSSAPAPVSAPTTPAPRPDVKTFTVNSPFVGTFYRSASPEVPAFVDVGSRSKKGQVLCIVEAMKLMNEIEAEQPGSLVEVLVENGSPVEYGEPLFRFEPALASVLAQKSSSPTAARSRSASSARAGNWASRRWRSTPTADAQLAARQVRRPELLHRAASARGELPQHPGASSRRPRYRAPTPSTPAMASSPRTPSLPSVAARAGSGFIGPRPEMIRMMGNKVRAQGGDEARRACRNCPARRRARGRARRPQRGREDRLPGDPQGGGGRRRARHEDRATGADTLDRAFRTASAEACGLRQRRHVRRAVRRAAAPHRDPDRGRQARRDHPPRRARVHACSGATRRCSRSRPAPPSTTSCAQKMGEVAVEAMQRSRLQQRRHHRVSARRARRTSTSWR